MSEEQSSPLLSALSDEGADKLDELTIPDEEFFQTTLSDYDRFDDEAWNQGEGYKCPNFPLFDGYMEGLEPGFFLFGGESNSGKTAVMMNLIKDYCTYADNKLFGIYFSLDDSQRDIIPRFIAMDQEIPISVCSKPTRYVNLVNDGAPDCALYNEWLLKREEGLNRLRDMNQQLKIVDGTKIHCAEQMLSYCVKLKSYLQAIDMDMNLLVGIDSLSDMVFATENFSGSSRDRQLNDHIARTVKSWAVEILDCPIFGSLHLRKVDGGRRPTVADVKDSGRYIYEASTLFLVYNDVNKNRESAIIYNRDDDSLYKKPIIELEWAKNKKSSYKGISYMKFKTECSLVTECSAEQSERYRLLKTGSL